MDPARVVGSDGCGWGRTGLFSNPWGRPVSNGGHLSADMMIFIVQLRVVNIIITDCKLGRSLMLVQSTKANLFSI